MIYLDNAATTYQKPDEVYEEMDRVNRTLSVNAGRGGYKAAREASAILDDLKDNLRHLFGCSGRVILTPSVTIALYEILNGIEFTQESVIYESPYEHNAVARNIEAIRKRTGCTVQMLPLLDDLSIDLDKTAYLFAQDKPTVVIMNALSNVTGYPLPIKELCSLAKEYDAITIIDAAQAGGLLELNMKDIQADVICFAGHKSLYGPFGIGGAVLNPAYKHNAVIAGGTGSDSLKLDMPSGSDPASPNIVAAAGLNAALKVLNVAEHHKKISNLTEYLIGRLKDLPKVRLMGVTDKTLGVVSITVDGYSASDVGQILDDEFDIAVREGYHCAPFIHDYLKDKGTAGTVRVGLGIYNTEDDIDHLIMALQTL